MERLAAFFEFLAACPDLQFLIDNGFSKCLSAETDQLSRCSWSICPLMDHDSSDKGQQLMRLTEIEPGTPRNIARINADKQVRKQHGM